MSHSCCHRIAELQTFPNEHKDPLMMPPQGQGGTFTPFLSATMSKACHLISVRRS